MGKQEQQATNLLKLGWKQCRYRVHVSEWSVDTRTQSFFVRDGVEECGVGDGGRSVLLGPGLSFLFKVSSAL